MFSNTQKLPLLSSLPTQKRFLRFPSMVIIAALGSGWLYHYTHNSTKSFAAQKELVRTQKIKLKEAYDAFSKDFILHKEKGKLTAILPKTPDTNLDREGFIEHFITLSQNALPDIWISDITFDKSPHISVIKGKMMHPHKLEKFIESLNASDVFKNAIFKNVFIETKSKKLKRRRTYGTTNTAPPAYDFLLKNTYDEQKSRRRRRR